MTSRPTDAWTSQQAYEPYVGRWSRLVAPRFLRWLPAASPAAWCDVGCGTGALAHSVLATERPARVLGVDPSAAYLAAARHGAAGDGRWRPGRHRDGDCRPRTASSTGSSRRWC